MNGDKQLPRMGWWLVAAIAGLALVWVIAPQMVKVTVYKLSLMPAAAWILYHVDLAINSDARPHELIAKAADMRAEVEQLDPEHRTSLSKLHVAAGLEYWARDRLLRRTILVAAGLVAVALGS